MDLTPHHLTPHHLTHRERQRDVRTLRQKLTRYRSAMVKGLFADFFAFFGDKKAEAASEVSV